MNTLEGAADESVKPDNMALYFGCWDSAGHFLHDAEGNHVWRGHGLPDDLPWTENLMDTTLLKNGGVVDKTDGRVYWTCGGAKALWYAFYWWDRSVDTRGGCNSGFYVRGFAHQEAQAAFDYACIRFRFIVKRQKYTLILQDVDKG